MPAAELVFSIRNLVVAYGDNVVLDVPSLDIPRGKMIFLLGHSGSGKTTFLETLGLMNSDVDLKGQIVFYPLRSSAGIDYHLLWGDEERLAAFRKDHFTFMFQDTHLFPQFSTLENVALTQIIKNTKRRDAIVSARSQLARLGIEEKGLDRISELSGGERQRVAFARALLAQGNVLFADEPTGNLGEDDARLVMRDIRDFVDGSDGSNTAIVVSHNQNLALEYGDEIIIIQEKNHLIHEENVFAASSPRGDSRFAGVLTEDDLRTAMRYETLFGGQRPVAPVDLVTQILPSAETPDAEFKTFYGPRSTEELSLKKKMNLILVAILGFAFLSIGFSAGALDVLKKKMQDPFVNWITVDVPYDKRDSLQSVKNYLEDVNRMARYSIRQVAPFKKYPLNVFNPRVGGPRDSYGRTIGIHDPILAELNHPDILVEGKMFVDSTDIGLVVTEEFLDYAGVDRSSGFVLMAMSVGEEKRTLSVPVPIRGIVRSLPGQSQFLTTEYFENKRDYDPASPFNPVHARMIALYCEGPESNAGQVIEAFAAFVEGIDSLKNRLPQYWTEEVPGNQRSLRGGYLAKANFIPDLTLSQVEGIVLLFQRTHKFAFRTTSLFEYPNTPMELLPEYSRFNRLSIHVSDLEHVSLLREDIFRLFGLEIDMAKVEALNNYRMVTKLTATLSAFIIVISVLSVCIFMIYILYVHLYKNRRYLGMLKAFGAAPTTLKGIYLQRMLRSLSVSTALALLLAAALGYSGAVRSLASLWMPIEPNQLYFGMMNVYPLIFVLVLFVLAYGSIYVTANSMLRLSPGKLIYDRLGGRNRSDAGNPSLADGISGVR